MATDHNHHAQHSDVGYERTDLSHRGIWAFFAFLAISAVVIFAAMAALYKGFNFASEKLAPPVNPMAQQQPQTTAKYDPMQNNAVNVVDIQKFSANGTQPLLQVNEPADMNQFLQEENTLLNAAPWRDAQGNVHIPIDRAMQLVAQHNMPSRANASDPAAPNPELVPTESGFLAVAQIHSAADATQAGLLQPTGNEPSTKPMSHSINPTGERKPATNVPERMPKK